MIIKKIFCLLLFSMMLESFPISAMDNVPQIGRIREKNGALSFYADNHELLVCTIGGALTAVGLFLIIYGNIKRTALQKQQNAKLEANQKMKLEEDLNYYKRWYWFGAALSLLGIGVVLCKAKQNPSPVVTLDNNGISAGNQHIAWQNLADIQRSSEQKAHKSYDFYQASFNGNNGSMTIPTTEYSQVYSLRFLEKSDFSDKPSITISEDSLPISLDDFRRIAEGYCKQHNQR